MKPLLLDEEQQSIQRTARAFVRERLPIGLVRALRDREDAIGFDRDAWREMARLGLAGCAVPARWGGGGLGYAELGIVIEECGRTLAATPLASTMVLASTALLLGGTDAQREEHLGAACAGERVIAVAIDEGTRHAHYRAATRAERAPGGWRLRGEKTMVLDGHVADAIVVLARVAGADADRDGLALFLVPRGAPGLTVERRSLVDGRNAARVVLDGVIARDADAIGAPGEAAPIVDAMLDRATIALSAEMLGASRAAFEETIAYLKTRRQFGVPIGSFQALKHRAAHLFCELELSRSIVMAALRAIDEERDDVPALASAAKARLGDTFRLVAGEAIQMHGGIGVTDELDVGFFYKRAAVANATFGDAAYHRDRFARLGGY